MTLRQLRRKQNQKQSRDSNDVIKTCRALDKAGFPLMARRVWKGQQSRLWSLRGLHAYAVQARRG